MALENHHNEKYYSSKSKHISLIIKTFFNKKLVTWRYLYIKSTSDKKEVCRICETAFAINEFFFHARYCMEQKVYAKGLMDIKNKIKKLIDDITKYKEISIIKPANQKLSIASSEVPVQRGNLKKNTQILSNSPTQKFLDDQFKSNTDLDEKNKKLLDSLNYFQLILKKEKTQSSDSYENLPYMLVGLNKTIHNLTNQILLQTVSKEKNEQICGIYFQIVQILIIKDKILEMLLLDKIDQDKIQKTKTDITINIF